VTATKKKRDDLDWVLPRLLRRGIRQALDAGRGRLRMDPQELANLLGKAIDLEIERLRLIRIELEQKQHIEHLLRGAERYVAPRGRTTARGGENFQHPIEYEDGQGGQV